MRGLAALTAGALAALLSGRDRLGLGVLGLAVTAQQWWGLGLGLTGVVLVPGEPDKSALLRAIRHTDEKLAATPRAKLVGIVARTAASMIFMTLIYGLAAFGITWQQRLGAVFVSGVIFLWRAK